MAELLRMEGITKQFGAVYANKDINLSIEEGEIHTLLGENGAGKSTLMNILIGLYQPTSGTIWLKGKKVKIDSPKTAVKLGIGMVHQHFMLVDAMTVFENIILGTKKDSSIFIKKEERKKEILELSQKYGLEVDLDKQVNEITKEERRRLVETTKTLTFTLTGLRPFKEAIITQGGVDVKGINPSTMEAKKAENLYFAGEVLDVDAVTGGFNLQIAWSTGWAAGKAAAEKIQES